MVAEAGKNTDSKETTALVGMSEIAAFMRRSEKTMLDLIRFEGFPAKKLGGIWESDTVLAAEWRRQRIAQAHDEGQTRERAT